MQFEHEVAIEAAVDDVWAAYSDVERWPEWAASFRSVHYTRGDSLVPGARVRIAQPKLPKAEWEVTEVEPGRSWTWVAKAPGATTVAVHELVPVDDRRTRVHTALTMSGPLGAILARLWARLTRSYLAMEAAGLKQRSEARAAA